MARLGAEMRHVDNGRGIRRKDLKHFAGLHRHEPLASFQHRQRAKEMAGIKALVGTGQAHRPPATLERGKSPPLVETGRSLEAQDARQERRLAQIVRWNGRPLNLRRSGCDHSSTHR